MVVFYLPLVIVYTALAHELQRGRVLFFSPVSVQIHLRSCARALDKVKAMRNDAVHPATMQRYLVRWATWWDDAIQSMGVM